jgi:methylated-DNA-[protein]-cysteine S-methyltransferase
MTSSSTVAIAGRRTVSSPLGPVTLFVGRTGLAALHLAGDAGPDGEPASEEAAAVLEDSVAQLGEYFAGTRTRFDLPLEQPGSAFQRAVWEALIEIPYGRTSSYGDVARVLGKPRAAQAVGMACGSNPIAIVVPCHRVIGASGRLTGYAGGLDVKRRLLLWEQRDIGLF